MPSLLSPERSYAHFAAGRGEPDGAARRHRVRARDFTVEWIEFADPAQALSFGSDAELLVLVARGTVRLATPSDAGGLQIPADAVAIVPSGTHAVRGSDGARCAVIASRRTDLPDDTTTGAAADADRPSPPPAFRGLQQRTAPQVLTFDQIKASAEKPRLKMLQTETLSINIVDYRGPRDRTALSPHSHADFEQGSLAIEGDFVHHLRTPWGSDANQWRDDEHLAAPSPSLVVVPPHVIHTSEGTGDGRHVLIDVFSPPRRDFIASGWVFNAGDYRAER